MRPTSSPTRPRGRRLSRAAGRHRRRRVAAGAVRPAGQRSGHLDRVRKRRPGHLTVRPSGHTPGTGSGSRASSSMTGGIVTEMPARPSLIEFPADDPERARQFWSGLLEQDLQAREDGEGDGWQTRSGGQGSAVGVHERGRGPGDSFSLPYFEVADLESALTRVTELGGTVVHPGTRWAVCRDSEGSPFGLAGAGRSLRIKWWRRTSGSTRRTTITTS